MSSWPKIVSWIILTIVTFPLFQNLRTVQVDSFPFSYYPMFSKDRGKHLELVYIIGVNKSGLRLTIPINYAGDGGFHQVRKQINRKYARGQIQQLCDLVANQIQEENDPKFSDIDNIQFVHGRFNITDYFAGNKSAVKEVVVASTPLKH